MKTLNLYPIDYPFETLIARMNSDPPKLILDPEFQRTYKWDEKGWSRASKFIESCLMRIPLPSCYFAETEENKHIVIDGVQRLSTIDKFFKDEFALEDLTTFKDELEGKKFSELGDYQSELEGTTIRCIVLRKNNPKGLIQEIFSRLNQGAVELSNQEIRHAVYPGPLDDLLSELAEIEPIKSFQLGEKSDRKKDSRESDEQVLRFFAFDAQQDLSTYDGKLHKFLDDFMATNQNIDNSEVTRLRDRFETTLYKCLLVFGDDAFKNLTRDRPQQSLVLYDLQMWGFANVDESFVKNNKTAIKNRFVELCEMEEFERTLSGGTQHKTSIIKRRELWEEKLREIGIRDELSN